MDNPAQTKLPSQEPVTRSFLRNPIVIVIAALVMAACIYLLFFAPSTLPPSGQPLPFGPQEQTYAAKLQFSHFAMSRAENFLHQEVTIISGDVLNGGDRPLRAVEVTITFRDYMNQIALRETRPIFPPNSPPLAPGKSLHFDISFDHVPDSWNMQVPSFRVSGLQFAEGK